MSNVSQPDPQAAFQAEIRQSMEQNTRTRNVRAKDTKDPHGTITAMFELFNITTSNADPAILKETDEELATFPHQPERPPRLGAKLYEHIKETPRAKTNKELSDVQQQLIYAIRGFDAMVFDMAELGQFNAHTEATVAIVSTIAEQRGLLCSIFNNITDQRAKNAFPEGYKYLSRDRDELLSKNSVLPDDIWNEDQIELAKKRGAWIPKFKKPDNTNQHKGNKFRKHFRRPQNTYNHWQNQDIQAQSHQPPPANNNNPQGHQGQANPNQPRRQGNGRHQNQRQN
jgi:hypothetical protein